MPDHTPEEINQIKETAKAQDRHARTAQEVVDYAVSHMGPERHYSKDKSQNKR